MKKIKVYLVVRTDKWDDEFVPIEPWFPKTRAEKRVEELNTEMFARIPEKKREQYQKSYFHVVHEMPVQDGNMVQTGDIFDQFKSGESVKWEFTLSIGPARKICELLDLAYGESCLNDGFNDIMRAIAHQHPELVTEYSHLPWPVKGKGDTPK